MKVLLSFLLTSLMLFANSSDTCYTIQLWSIPSNEESIKKVSQDSYPQECKVMQIGSSITVRCGCYEKLQDVENNVGYLQKNYKNAVITKTYRYRFNEDSDNEFRPTVTQSAVKSPVKKIKVQNFKPIESGSDDEELRLILQVYLYKTDLDNAYKVASLGYKRYPNSYYWNEQMAQISKWTNRSARSMKHLKKMYKLRYNKKLEEELIAYGTAAYQFEEIEPLVVNRARKYPTEYNIDQMILVYKKIGSPEKVIEVLEQQYRTDPTNRLFLTKALDLSLDIGDLELAQKYVNLLEAEKPYGKVDANLISKFYYVQQDIASAYETLQYVDSTDINNSEQNIVFAKLQSDLGWYLQDNVKAAEASVELMDLNESRLADYERISFVYQKTDPDLSLQAMQRAYEEYKLSYLFYSYANNAILNKQFDQLNDIVATIDEENDPLAQEALYWILKSKIYAHYSQKDLEKEALYRALELDPTNYQIKLTLLWYFMDMKDSMALEDLLTEMADDYEIDSSYFFPMASAYFFLSDINRASYYIKRLIDLESPVTNLTEFKFLEAYVLQIQNNEGGFKKKMKEILDDLEKKESEIPKLKTQDTHLSNYLRASINIHSGKKFSKKLKKSKKYLSKKNYDEIAYSWALKNNAYEKSLKIFNRMKAPELWVQFSQRINFQEHSKVEDILDLYLPTISMGDASQSAEKDGQIALSQSFTFEGYQKNDFNQNAYVHHRDLSKIRSDYTDVKTSYYNRDPLLQKYVKVYNKNYIANGYYLDTSIEYFNNRSIEETELIGVEDDTVEAGIGFTKVFDRGSVFGHIDLYDSMELYYGGTIGVRYRASTDLTFEGKLAINENALDSIQILLGGKKNMATFNVNWALLNSTSFNFLYEYNDYSSQDGVDIGYGNYARLSMIRQVRNGYPDIRLGAFFDYGLYDEESGSKGVIDELQIQSFPVLPEDFYNFGFTFSYGMANADDYTRAWRPYLEIYPYYNSVQDDYTVGVNLGYGGKAFHQDHLIFGATYAEDISGIGGRTFELFLDYHFMYRHP